MEEKKKEYHSKIESPDLDELFDTIRALESNEECYRFFEDLCTYKEIGDLAQRFQVAKRIDEGMTYTAISEATGASTATVTRVGKALKYGADGYRLALDRKKTK